MTFHTIGSYRMPVTGGKRKRGADKCVSPRIATSFDPEDFRHLAQLAQRNPVPIAACVRQAVAAWLRSINEEARL